MKENTFYAVFPSFVVRTPLLPFNFLQNLLSDNSDLNNKLKKIVSTVEINEALFIGTPEFHEQLKKWLACKDFEAKEEERIILTLYKYLSRMSSRCTPFGLFAGCTTGSVDSKTQVILSKSINKEKHTRLDMLYLCNLVSALSKNPLIRSNLKYFPNSTIYESGENIRYIEYRYNKDKRTHHLVQIRNSNYVNLILCKAREGATIDQLLKSLADEGIPFEPAETFVQNLINNQILINELEPSVTGDEFFQKILNVLTPIDNISNIKNILHQVNRKINDIDRRNGNDPASYLEIAKDLKPLEVDYDIKYLFQTDMNLVTSESSVSQSLINSLLQGLVVLNKLTPKQSETNIQKFKDAFIRRYETREIPLLKALDTEIGIGYLQNEQSSEGDISPLIADIFLPSKTSENKKLRWDSIQELLLKQILEAKANNSFEIEITDNDIKAFEVKWDDLPVTFSSMVSIVEGPSEQFPHGRILMEWAGNSSATNLLGRFCHGNKKIHQCAREITEYEQKQFSDVILAEIVHLPESRVGNVILRPVLRDFEISFLASPSVSKEYTISLDDLLISIKYNEVILRSKRLNKRVIPRMSNAHNYSSRALPVYQFLCDLQNQGIRSSINFNWGNLGENYSFKPRVIYKNLILSPAEWIIKKEEIKEIAKHSDNLLVISEVEKLRIKRRLPKRVFLEAGDNMLFIDFENSLSVKSLIASVKKRDSFRLKEFLFNPDNAIVKSEDGVYTNEFIFNFYRKEMRKDER